ncbi:MAG: H-type lectin domain-containing protein [Paracoccus sp. (in: a-proteobacteria)]|nr:H-type lectin domain-containing protein [Paracoccus sp. (in: a-proteobacteria)]
MWRLSHYSVGLLQGSEVLFSDFETDGEMWTGSGPRERRVTIRFPSAFRGRPLVHLGLSMWDIDCGENQRVDLRAEDVGPQGFTIVFATWGATRIARIRADWLAIGPALLEGDDEDEDEDGTP